ncbi:hypothetical protein FVQ98_09610 [Ottowia sp. GY511]|uniref:Spy/CpxP family protein refolding chaperone n=1 Tax=Ottowia flava TaxID=2675430 RepID=A0ABW4L1T9_9BURK|nr:Spy/CpxP family protein refolding chaperone [Ottowia sp. GY511]TXK28551.1 hypothetical protein FVQ98_09610 [Ottowia sp. GY511]
MTKAPKHLLLATLLAATGIVATAQTPASTAQPAPTAAPAAGDASAQPGQRQARGNPAERQKRWAEHRAKRQAELKAALKLTSAQEGAWITFTTATQPPARAERSAQDRDAFKNLNTPQRIDLMEKRMAERQAHMKQRGDAVKTFYAQLTPEQQKVFDERGMRFGKGEGKRGHRGGHHGHHGMGPGPR